LALGTEASHGGLTQVARGTNMGKWYLYIARCKDGSFYTGITTNPENRLKRHNLGKASKYTRARKPLELVYTREFSE